MSQPLRRSNPQDRQARAERILDAAAALLQRWGYSRITIDDIAAHAGIGKGTIYLHWKTREELFAAVLHRAAAETFAAVLETIRREPEAILLPRLTQNLFISVMQRPLMRAAFVGDSDLLGKLARSGDRAIDAQQEQAFHDYLRMLMDHGLLRTDLVPDELFYAYDATISGFFFTEQASAQYPLSLERRAELLALTVEHAFGVSAPRQDDIQAATPRVIALLTTIVELYQAQLQLAFT